MTWVKLRRGNDWATHFLTINLGSTHSMRDGYLRCKEGEPVEVRFPNGLVKSFPVCFVSIQGGYSDHGNDSVTNSYLPAVEVITNGVSAKITLDQLEVCEAWAREHGAT